MEGEAMSAEVAETPPAKAVRDAPRLFDRAATRVGLTIVCLLFGIALVVQLRTESRIRQSVTDESSTDLAAIAGDLYDSNTALRQEVDQLLSQQNADDRTANAQKQADMAAEIRRLKAFNGVVPVSGPGVRLVLDGDLRPVDVEDLLNELRNAGSEAIAIGGQRVVYNTAVGGTTGRVLVDGVALARPIVVDAIGDPDVLERAMARKGGMVTYLRTSYPDATITLTQRTSLDLPAHAGALPIQPGS
jgi:uncharacterized protein YlxW (UPF0749 family)